MKIVAWLALGAAVLTLGTLDARHGGPVAAAPRAHADAPATRGEAAPDAVRSAMGHLREEVRPGPGGSLVIANEAYRASFSADGGVAFTPHAGGRFDARLTWRYRARAIATDTTTRSLDGVTPAVSTTGDHIVDFRRPGLIERYEGERGGVEQIFVLSERPAGHGDVRIVGDVTFGGTGRPKDGGLEFDAGGGLPAFTYAKPIAFDANKAPVRVRVDLEGATLSLVLDSAGLERAQWPVTIDPLFGSTIVDAVSSWGMDLAYNADRGEFLVVYDGMDAGASDVYDRQIRVRRYRESGDALGASWAISNAGNEKMPSVAYDFHVHRYLVAWNRNRDVDITVQARFLDWLGAPIGAEHTFGAGTLTLAPDVVARNYREHGPADLSFAIAWSVIQADEPVARMARLRGDGVVLGEGQLSGPSGDNPRLSYDPIADRFFAVYVDDDGDRVLARTVSPVGAWSAEVEVGPLGFGLDGSGFRGIAVAFDVASRRHLVVWPGEGSGTIPLCGRFFTSAAQPVPSGGSFVITTPPSEWRFNRPSVVSETGSFLVGFQAHPYAPLDPGLFAYARVRADGLFLGGSMVDTAHSSFDETHVATSQHGFSPMGYRYSGVSPTEVRLSLHDRWFARYVHGGRAGDFDGDGRSDLFLYRASAGEVLIRTQSLTTWYVSVVTAGFPALLEYDGDGLTDIGIWEPSTGKWWIRLSTTHETVIPVLGRTGDIPVPGDYLGLGEDQIAIFRPSTGLWIIEPASRRLPTKYVTFGQLGDLPVPADWDGDGEIELGVWRPSTGVWYAQELDGTPVSIPATPWGQAGDIPLAGQFVGSAIADQIVYRRQLGVIFRRDGATGGTQTITVGGSGIPVPLDWDGNGRLEPTLFDASSGGWKINDAANTWVNFGTIGDIPAGAR